LFFLSFYMSLTPSFTAQSALPLVLLPCDIKDYGGQPFQSLGKKYMDAVRYGAHALPFAIPVGCTEQLEHYLDLAHGVVFPGSRANVHPSHFGQAVHDDSLPLDTDRDSTTLPMLRAVIERGIPMLAICRGIQELNVALGGSLHQAVQELPGKRDHREPIGKTLTEQYEPCHDITLTQGGMLHGLFAQDRIMVNSLHGQGIDRLADRLQIEALADDGVIEAVSVKHAKGFALGVQFHPEWDIQNNPLGQTIFGAFGKACHAYASSKISKNN
jgi:putative glutamine amidotransferase